MWANPVDATFRQNAIDFAEGCGIPELALNLVCPEVRGSGLVAQSPGRCSTPAHCSVEQVCSSTMCDRWAPTERLA